MRTEVGRTHRAMCSHRAGSHVTLRGLWTWCLLYQASLLLALGLWGSLHCAKGSSERPCVYDVNRGVLTVTLTNPPPSLVHYYILVWRKDDPDDFYDISQAVEITEETMIYEVYGIPSEQTHIYEVYVRPHDASTAMGGFKHLCELAIPPPPPPPLLSPSSPPPPPPSSPCPPQPTPPLSTFLPQPNPHPHSQSPSLPPLSHPDLPQPHSPSVSPSPSPPWTPDRTVLCADVEAAETGDNSRHTVLWMVMGGLVSTCFVVCVLVTIVAFLRRRRTLQKEKKPQAAEHDEEHTKIEEEHDGEHTKEKEEEQTAPTNPMLARHIRDGLVCQQQQRDPEALTFLPGPQGHPEDDPGNPWDYDHPHMHQLYSHHHHDHHHHYHHPNCVWNSQHADFNQV